MVVWKVMSIFVAEIPIIKNLNGMMEDKKRFNDGRRAFLKRLGLGVGTAVTMTKKQQFTEGLRKALPDVEKWARSCQDCEECLPKCPQQIRIPNQLARIVETLRRR